MYTLLALLLASTALAEDGDDDTRKLPPLHGGVSTSFTGWTGPVAADGSAFNPGAQLAVRPRVVVSDGAWTLMGFWGVSRTFQGCDVCDDATTAGGADARYQPLRAFDSDDLTVSIARSLGGGGRNNLLLATPLGATAGDDEEPTPTRTGPLSSLQANLRTDVVLPASRDALVCNPFYGAVGVGTVLSVAAGRSMVSASGSARRSFFRHDAAPVGLPGCAVDVDPVDTLAGPVDPTPWEGSRSANANALGAASTRLAWMNVHRLLLGESKVAAALTTQATLGLNASVRRQADATTVDTLAGPVAVEAGRHPWTTTVPFSLTAGWNVSRPLTLAMTVSNAVPGVLTDPGATFRNLPSRTAATFTADAHW